MTAIAAPAPAFSTTRPSFSPREFFDILAAAVRAASAVENHRQPKREDLLTLGIAGELPPML